MLTPLRDESSSVNPKPGTSSLGHVSYVQCQQPMYHVCASSANGPCATSVRPERPASPRPGPLTSGCFLGHRLSSHAHPGRTSRSVTHPQISPGQARLTSKFFGDRLLKKKLQLVCMSILLILLSSGPRCHSCKASFLFSRKRITVVKFGRTVGILSWPSLSALALGGGFNLSE